MPALERLGVRPDMTAGHSYGEYVALAAAGVISDSALFELSESRGRAIKDTTHDEAGTMAAVAADADAILKRSTAWTASPWLITTARARR